MCILRLLPSRQFSVSASKSQRRLRKSKVRTALPYVRIFRDLCYCYALTFILVSSCYHCVLCKSFMQYYCIKINAKSEENEANCLRVDYQRAASVASPTSLVASSVTSLPGTTDALHDFASGCGPHISGSGTLVRQFCNKRIGPSLPMDKH